MHVHFRSEGNSIASSSSSLASGGHRSYSASSAPSVLHTDVELDCDEDLKQYIESTIARSIDVYAASVTNGGANNSSQWMNTGKCWRAEYLAKNPAMDQNQRCRYKHPDLNSFTPPLK